MDPAEVVFGWLKQEYGKQLIESTIWNMWNEGGKWYVVVRSRSESNPSSKNNRDETLVVDEATGRVSRQEGACGRDGTPFTYISDDLVLRYTAFACRYCGPRESKYHNFKRRFDEAAKLLQDNDHGKRVEGAHMIVKLVEDGAGVIGPTARTEWQGRPHYNIEDPSQ